MRRTSSVLAALTIVLTAGLLTVGQRAASAATGTSGQYHAVAPKRILDTRTAAGGGALAAASTRGLTVTGSLVPSTASAVVVTATVTAPTAGGFLTVYPAGVSRPTTSSLNFQAGRTVPNLVVVGIGAGGKIEIYNGSSGRSQVLLDLAGYFTGSQAPAGQGAFGSLGSPRRVLDTRSGAPVASGASRSFTVTGNGVPAGASAVVLNLTATAETASGWVAAYAAGGTRPATSNLNFVRGVTAANLAVVPVGASGEVTLYNGSSGSTHYLADIAGYFRAGDPVAAGALGSLAPARLLDTRSGIGAAKAALSAGKTLTLAVAGRGGVPRAGVAAVVLNVTATAGSRSGHLTVYGSGTPPTVSQVNYAAGQTVADLVVAPVSSGKVTVYNGGSGSVQVIGDVSGYVLGTALAVPALSTSRYVRNITGATSDATTMRQEGCGDAGGGSAFVLLDIGAQSNTNDPASANGTVLSPTTPGVRLTLLDPPVRLTYDQLETAVKGYLDGFAGSACNGPAVATIAVSTNNDGDFTAYPAAAKASDWAKVINSLRAYVAAKSYPGKSISVVGANDIEPNLASTAAQARTWVTDYLAATPPVPLVYNGSAGGCPGTYGSTAACGAVKDQTGPTWSSSDFVALAYGLGPGRIRVLPQIYYPYMAVQWANLLRASDNRMTFAGSLTENASSCGADCAMTPAEGWAALHHALSTVVASPSLPAMTDLRIDD